MPGSSIMQPRDELLVRRRSLGRAMVYDSDLPGELIKQLWGDPHSLLARGKLLQDKPRCMVVKLDTAVGPLLLKHHNWGGPIRTFKKSLRRAPAKQSWLDGRLLYAAGVRTPRPRAYVKRCVGPFGVCSYLLTDFIEGTTLYRLMRFDNPSSTRVLELAQKVAAIWQQLDDLCVSHNDLKAENFLIDRGGEMWLIDLEKMRRHGSVEQARGQHAQDAHRLLHPRNWRSNPAAAKVFRQAILATRTGQAGTMGKTAASHPLLKPRLAENRASELVSVVIICRDHQRTIAACLDSVRDMADEVCVVDAGSTDRTMDLVRKVGGCRVISNLEDLATEVAHSWVLMVHGNECLSADLAKEVQDVLCAEPKVAGFRIARRYFLWGRTVKFAGLRHDVPVRLFRKDAVKGSLQGESAEWIVTAGKVCQLRSKLLYEPWSSMVECLDQLRSEAVVDARRQFENGKRARVSRVLLGAPWRFFQTYILRHGWLDGWAGLHASCLAVASAYLRELALWEIDNTLPPPRSIDGDWWRARNTALQNDEDRAAA